MKSEELFEKIVKIIRMVKEVEEDVIIDEETVLISDLGIDSLGRFLLVDELEETFEIEIQDDEMFGIHTVGDIVTKIENKLENNGQ
jgi:acyl carrier protein